MIIYIHVFFNWYATGEKNLITKVQLDFLRTPFQKLFLINDNLCLKLL